MAPSEAIPSQTPTEVVATLAILPRRDGRPTAERLADIAGPARALGQRGFATVAGAVSETSADLDAGLGKLNSRSTGVPGRMS